MFARLDQNRRPPCSLCALMLCLGMLGVTAQVSWAETPNVILIMCDDLGWGDVGFNGNKVIRTPHLDAMAKRSLTFERFYAAAPVCSPTRGSALTGRHPYRYGILTANAGHLPPREMTMAELLRQYGYRTGHFGKWHLGTLTKTMQDANRGGPENIQHFSPPQANGFDVCFSTESKVPTYDPTRRPLTDADRDSAKKRKGQASPGGWWNALQPDEPFAFYNTRYWNQRGEHVTENLAGDDSRIIMDRAIPFVEHAVDQRKPFFAVIWFHAPHLPVVAGPKHFAMYDGHSDYERNYYGCITALDEQVGRLRDTLRRLNVAEDTMIWFCSDNGPEGNKGTAPGSAGPFRGRKRSLYEGGVRVPGLLEWPQQIKEGRSTQFAAVTSDFLPTILDVLGHEPPMTPLDGISLMPLIRGQVSQREKPIGFQHGKQVALNGLRYKLIGNASRTRLELYDLRKDPGETRDLAAEHPDKVRELTRILAEWQSSCRESRSVN